jgi:hypothetical protein
MNSRRTARRPLLACVLSLGIACVGERPEFPECGETRGSVSSLNEVVDGSFRGPSDIPVQALVGDAGVPEGSYQHTCRSCRVSDGTLHCMCGDAAARPVETSLAFDSCSLDINNCGGDLTCGSCASPPPGSYLKSCSGCVVNNTTVTCQCFVGSKAAVSSATLECTRDITNCRGRLTCGPCCLR